jgi:hypothetical protein
MDFTGGFVFPVPAMLQSPVKFYCAGARTIINTAAAIPALIRMQYHRWFAFLGVRNIYINLAHLYTMVTAVAYLFIECHRTIRRRKVRYGDYFFLGHFFLQKPKFVGLFSSSIYLYKHRYSLCYELRIVFSCCPRKSKAICRS